MVTIKFEGKSISASKWINSNDYKRENCVEELWCNMNELQMLKRMCQPLFLSVTKVDNKKKSNGKWSKVTFKLYNILYLIKWSRRLSVLSLLLSLLLYLSLFIILRTK